MGFKLPKLVNERTQLNESGFSQFWEATDDIGRCLSDIKNYYENGHNLDFYITKGKNVGSDKKYVAFVRDRNN